MKTEEANETTPAEAGSTTPITPELIGQTFDEQGICENPERIEVKMPKGCDCRLYVAYDARRAEWFAGCDCTGPKGTGVLASMARIAPDRPGHSDRGTALACAFGEAYVHFTGVEGAGKCVRALEFFAEAHGVPLPAERSPANTGADGADTLADAAPVKGEFAEIPVSAVSPNPRNHRKIFDPGAIAELAESIRREGLLQPIAVRVVRDEQLPGMEGAEVAAERYEIILGERRWRAHVEIGAQTIQAKVYRGIDANRAQVLALIENLQRVQLNPIEEAEGYAELIGAGLTQEAIAQRCGRSRPVVANAMRLLKLPAAVLDLIRAGELTTAHGVALARFAAWPAACAMIAKLAAEDEATAASLEGDSVPYAYALEQRGLAVQLGWAEVKEVRKKLGKHPAYLFTGCGTAYCFDPAHWAAELAEKERRAKAKREAELAEQAEAAKKSRKLVSLQDLQRDDYRRFEGPAHEKLLELVPEEKKTIAKGLGEEGRVTIVTDVTLADKLKAAMQRAIKADRKRIAEDLRTKMRKKLASHFPITTASTWLLYLASTHEGQRPPLRLSAEAAAAAGVMLPEELLAARERDGDFEGEAKDQASLLAALGSLSAHDAARVLAHERLPRMLDELIEYGPESVGAKQLRWWLGTETLWLLEETDDGRAELLEQVKNAPWYKALLAGETAAEEGGEE